MSTDNTSTPSREQLELFCETIRGKPDWITKILDEKRGLAEKWAQEAGFLKEGESVDDSNVVVNTLRELKADARRIRYYDHMLRADSICLPSRLYPSQEIDVDVQRAWKYLKLARYAIRPPPLKEDVGAYISDGAVPPSLHRELVKELDALAAIEPKDFHPGTRQTVQNLIHPSLYPYVAGITPINDPAKLPMLWDNKFITTMSHSGLDQTLESQYAWVPSIFRVSEDGTDAHIESYINGLGSRERFPVLYRLIEQVFVLALPHLERSLDFKFKAKEPASKKRWFERGDARSSTTRDDWDKLLERQKEEKEQQEAQEKSERERTETEALLERKGVSKFMDDTTDIKSRFSGKDVKVIVKAANYILKPGQQYEGTWHIEGQPHEQITASLIYYYDTDEAITDSGLSLRRLKGGYEFTSEDELHQDEFLLNIKDEEPILDEYGWEVSQWDCPSDWEDGVEPSTLPNHIKLGTVSTNSPANDDTIKPTGRMLSFPNWVQHKVVGVKNSSSVLYSEPAKRKTLCFFLVQEEGKSTGLYEHSLGTQYFPGGLYDGLEDLDVLTTADIPSQERACNVPTLRFLLSLDCQRLTSRCLPPELTEHILNLADLGITREQAEKNRRSLMDDRRIKGVELNSDVWEEKFSLCEH